ncbi:MAG: hypothetical protein ACRD0I_01565 [Acidimicrobiales bacterium]
MSALLYLVVPILLCAVVGVVVVAKGRRPRSMEAGIEDFSKGLRALKPGSESGVAKSGGSRRSGGRG